MTISPFYVGIVVSSLEPENLAGGVTAVLGGFPQIALGTVIGSAIFLLTAALGISLLLVPMEIRIAKSGGVRRRLSRYRRLRKLVPPGVFGDGVSIDLIPNPLGVKAGLAITLPPGRGRLAESGSPTGRPTL